MTFKLKKTELIKALMTVLCALAVAFAVALLMPHEAASADEPVADEPTAVTYAVEWEYLADLQATEWQPFGADKTLFTYTEGEDYSNLVRAKIDLGEATAPEYIYYNANGSSGTDPYLSYAGTQYAGTADEIALNTLEKAAEYTITIHGEFAAGVIVADADRTIKVKIAPRTFDLHASNLIDYDGSNQYDRLWILSDGSGLVDLATYYDPAAAFNVEYGANVTVGLLFNSYVRYTGQQNTIELNENYRVGGKTLKDYRNAIKGIDYSASTAVGEENKVFKTTTTATIALTADWTLDDGGNAIVLTKDWYIVTTNNALRAFDGAVNTMVESWSYGGEVPALSIRPEHGDHAVFTFAKGNEVIDIFAVKYSGRGANTILEYYGVKLSGNVYVIDTDKPLDGEYCAKQMELLKVGVYTLNVSVPAYTAESDHEHWWAGAVEEATQVVYYPISRTYIFNVNPYEINEDNISDNEDDRKDIVVTQLTDHVDYNAQDNNVPEVVVTFRGVQLVYDVDYEIISHDVNVGKASFTVMGKGSFSGQYEFRDVYDIDPAVNTWKDVPSIMYWTYRNYNKNINLIGGTPAYLDNPSDISFKVTMDMWGNIPTTDELASFILTDGIVSDDVANALSSLNVGTYYLFATVKESTNYKALAPHGVPFKVFAATNGWEIAPSVVSWTEGKFTSNNMPTAKPLYGDVSIVIKDKTGKDVYNSVTGVNKLSSAEAGTYTLKATVIGSNDYSGLDFNMVFTVHVKPGIPVWATLLIVLGVLLLVAAIILILIKTGILRILTGKLMITIRTQAAVEATVASVRAAKKNDEYKQHLAEVRQKQEAEARRKEQRREKAAIERSLTADQRIAALEERASKTAVRAEKMRERAEIMQKRVARMKEAAIEAEQEAPAPTTEAAATDDTTPAEE